MAKGVKATPEVGDRSTQAVAACEKTGRSVDLIGTADILHLAFAATPWDNALNYFAIVVIKTIVDRYAAVVEVIIVVVVVVIVVVVVVVRVVVEEEEEVGSRSST